MIKRILGIALATVLALSTLSGCGFTMENNDSDTVAVIFEGENIYMEEAKLYVYTAQRQMEEQYAGWMSMFNNSYKTFWDANWGSCISFAMQNLYQTKVLVKEAAKRGISLTTEEEKQVVTKMRQYRDQYPQVFEYAKAGEEKITQFFTENALANKVYNDLVKDVDTNLDAEEFLRKKAWVITVTALNKAPEEETETEDETESEAESESEAEASYTDDEKKVNAAAAADEIKKYVEEGKTQEEIKELFKDSKTVSLSFTEELTLTPENKKAEDAESYTSYQQMAWDLKTGEIGDYGKDSATVYVVKMLNDNDPELRKEAEDSEMLTRRTTLFQEKYKELLENYKEFHVYEEKFGNVKFKEAIMELPTEEEEASEEE